MNKEDYEKIKESLKNTGVINELERVYNKEFVKDMVDYFEGKLEYNYYLKDAVEQIIDTNLNELLRIVNSNMVSSSHNIGSTPSTSNNDVSIDSIHEKGNRLSSELGIKILDEQIKELENDINSINKAINDNNLKNKRLKETLIKKQYLVEMLKNNKKTLNKNTSLVDNKDNKISKNDKQLIELENNIEEKEQELETFNKIHLNDKREQRKLNRNKIKLQKQIAILKNKKGILMAKQMKLTQKELINYYKKSEKRSNKMGKDEFIIKSRIARDERLNSVKEKIEKEGQKAWNDISSPNILKSNISVAKVYISYYKHNLVDKYCSLLKRKDGVVDGLRKVPDELKQAILANRGNLKPARAR